jgi:hypothetical protein
MFRSEATAFIALYASGALVPPERPSDGLACSALRGPSRPHDRGGRPLVDYVVSLAETSAAHARIEEVGRFGKIV